ncbi:amino acid ABC transporter permease [Rhizobacter sp. Root404]|uniref:amino acid ABC transporter permease n=1 Tax=Rhizobacter sp. Root404 TaxID=1736528 RepID=UPI0006FA25F8|nr:amino acid ABC transporter permease [Rhizobacter sp. Root404]KQW39219.1 amino acid ABC transporter permease [Rhizobacter sp. Root404]
MTTLSWPHLASLLQGALWTIALSLLAFLFGGIAGMAVALMRTARARWVRQLSGLYVQIIQGTPLLIVIFLAYFGLSVMGFNLPAIVAASLSITVYAAAYLGEIWRGCIEAVPRTQWEAADTLGFSRAQSLALVIIPQAMRIATPPTVGFMVQIVKNTSIASIVGFAELTYTGKVINNSTFQPFVVYVIVAAIYFCMCYPLSRWSRALERKLNVAHR